MLTDDLSSLQHHKQSEQKLSCQKEVVCSLQKVSFPQDFPDRLPLNKDKEPYCLTLDTAQQINRCLVSPSVIPAVKQKFWGPGGNGALVAISSLWQNFLVRRSSFTTAPDMSDKPSGVLFFPELWERSHSCYEMSKADCTGNPQR